MTVIWNEKKLEFEIFPWSQNFETGLDDIDNQHRMLVDIVNRLASQFSSINSDVNSATILDELEDYAKYHFEYEENVWKKHFGQSKDTKNHHDAHQTFFHKIRKLRQTTERHEAVLANLFNFITRWLVFHILESDRRLALTIQAMDDGMDLYAAKTYADMQLNGSASVLVSALLEIYGKLSANTIQLIREKTARKQAEDELHQLQQDQLLKALDKQAVDHQKQLEFLAYSDSLTGLWNRNGLVRCIREMRDTIRSTDQVSIISLNLDNFKETNKQFGEDAGDHVLWFFSQRWLDVLPPGATVARISGDQFAALLPNGYQAEPVLQVVQEICKHPVVFNDKTISIRFTAGVFLFSANEFKDGSDVDALLRFADQTLFNAKQEAKGSWLLMDANQKKAHQSRQRLLTEIREALKVKQFQLVYQPKVNLRTGSVLGVEALIRWKHPEKGLLSPAYFLSEIENHPLIVDIGRWVIEESLQQMHKWDQKGLNLTMSVNVAALHLQSPAFSDELQQSFDRFPEIDPSRFDLEILETATLGDLQSSVLVINECRSMGVTFSLDDFGTGYSSLAYLKQLPVQTIKIDKEFVSGADERRENMSILEGIIALAEAFDKEVIAEGVETIEQGELLLELGCFHAQGYAMSPPLPPERLPQWLACWKPFLQWTLGHRK
ncbi:bacteriohemerythrin [Salinivibrio sp. MA607]|uniref:bacteriohemerythrin n=1 Tax=Salinivibrio sp. MA607 TaxID=1909457 RepID=UPI0018E30BEA|nr:bacteriohemerythrin [Salinivibrio sp. MA607]